MVCVCVCDPDPCGFVFQGVSLPKLQPKFENYVKNGFKISDSKVFNVSSFSFHMNSSLYDRN